MLTTGLLVGSAGGAIASADDSAGTTTQSQGAESAPPSVAPASASTTTAATTPKSPIGRAIQDVLNKLHAVSRPVQKPVIVKATPTPIAPVPDTPAPETEVVPAANDVDVAGDSKAFAAESDPTPPTTNTVAPTPAPPSATPDNVLPPALKAVQPVTTAMAKVAGVAMSVPGVLAALPTSETPVADVITSVQDMLISVNDAVAPLVEVPGDLYSLLVFPGINAPLAQPVNVGSGLGLSTLAAMGPAAPTPPTPPAASPILPISPVSSMPLRGDVATATALGGIATVGLSTDLSLAGMAPLATEAAAPTSPLSFLEHTVRAFLEHTVRAVLAPASLTALAAFALPGIGGLLIICAAGIRVGYRQAKAALAVRSSVIARFARQGPLGVVRTGSLVSLHPRRSRGPRVDRPEIARAVPLLERVA
ncbi:hypothetical protein ACGFK1_32470 [Mycobacterium sp. NPDC048908]|uniref:hypothetical protein n=1 Tax=Mycobacterium sp. NPDC048908 TaxID=3364292 RepID=UPI0037128241